MIPSFESGAPRTGPDLHTALGTVLAQGTAYLATMPLDRFFAPQGSAWSPADHVRHLEAASSPLVLALRLPRWLLALRFGRSRGKSRPYAEMREVYLARLAAGAGAGRFTPRPEVMPADPGARRAEIINAWTRVTIELQHALSRWPEDALDRGLLPHPLLGRLTVREMLEFTLYHSAHHLRRVAERAAP